MIKSPAFHKKKAVESFKNFEICKKKMYLIGQLQSDGQCKQQAGNSLLLTLPHYFGMAKSVLTTLQLK